MENKSNDATPLRPQGERLLNAPMVEMDLNKFIQQIKQEVTWKESSLNSITLFKSDKMRIVLIGIHKNGELKTHTAPGYISVQVMEGHIEFATEEKTVQLFPGQMVSLQPQLPHSVFAKEESFFLLTLALA